VARSLVCSCVHVAGFSLQRASMAKTSNLGSVGASSFIALVTQGSCRFCADVSSRCTCLGGL